MGIVADNRRDHARRDAEKLRVKQVTTCKCGKRLEDHLELLNGKCFDCMCKRWEVIAEDSLF